jgi:hypothetical protein
VTVVVAQIGVSTGGMIPIGYGRQLQEIETASITVVTVLLALQFWQEIRVFF